jgi:hypothetical protein
MAVQQPEPGRARPRALPRPEPEEQPEESVSAALTGDDAATPGDVAAATAEVLPQPAAETSFGMPRWLLLLTGAAAATIAIAGRSPGWPLRCSWRWWSSSR